MDASRPGGSGSSQRVATALEVCWGGQRLPVVPGRAFVIGRDEGADLQVVHPKVSRRHLVLQPVGQGWQLVDQSSNGSFIDGRRIGRLGVTGSVTVSLGAPANAPSVVIGIAVAQGRPSAVHNLAMDRLRIGRAPDNDIVLDDLLVSRHHAELLRRGPDWWLEDLDSSNGSYVNGQRVTGAPLGSQDVVGIGHALLQVNGDRLVERVDVGEVSFRAHGLVVRTSAGRQFLDRVGFSLEQRSLLAVVGPSGAGNTTLRSRHTYRVIRGRGLSLRRGRWSVSVRGWRARHAFVDPPASRPDRVSGWLRAQMITPTYSSADDRTLQCVRLGSALRDDAWLPAPSCDGVGRVRGVRQVRP